MSHAMNDHEMVLRSVLRAAAEQLEPAADGLERIKAQLRPPLPLPLAWVCAMWTRLCLRVPDGLWTVIDRVAREFRLASERFMPAAGSHGSGRRHDRLSWLRPVAAMSVVVFIVTAVVYMAIVVPQAISPGSFNTNQPAGGHASSQGTGNGSRNTQTQPGGGPLGSLGSGQHGSIPPACSATPKATTPPPTISQSSSPPASPSPSQTVSPTPNPTSPSPSPTSPSPSASSSSSPTSGAAAPGGTGSSPSAGPAASPVPDASPTAGGTVMKTPLQSTVARSTPTPCPSPGPTKKSKPPTASPAAAGLLPPALTATERTAATYY